MDYGSPNGIMVEWRMHEGMANKVPYGGGLCSEALSSRPCSIVVRLTGLYLVTFHLFGEVSIGGFWFE